MVNSGRIRWWIGAAAVAVALVGMAARGASATEGAGARAEAEGSILRLDEVVQRAIGVGATPGAAVAIGHAAGEVVIRTYGRTDWSKSAPPVTDSTLYDLASLTKVMAATPAAMLLVQEGLLKLDAPISRYLSWWPRKGEKGRITARELLLHQAGFPAGEALRGYDRSKRIRSIASRPLLYAPGSRTVYSDISMVVLGAVVESITGERLDRFVTRQLYMPLQMRDTRFNPLRPVDAEPFGLARIAPTLRVGDRHIHGTVQDPTARRLAGVSGNAGLFSSIRDVARFARLMLVGAEGMSTPVLADSIIRMFTARSPGAARSLGWDGPTGGTLWGPYFSDASFGHTGYTGTSIWIDPLRDVFVVLLTNRLDPSADNEKHMALRRAVNALVDHRFVIWPPESDAGTFTAFLPSRPGPGPFSASLLGSLPFRSGDGDDLLDSAAAPPGWFAPAESDVAPHAGAGLTLLLLFLLSSGLALVHDPAVQRRVRALVRALRRNH